MFESFNFSVTSDQRVNEEFLLRHFDLRPEQKLEFLCVRAVLSHASLNSFTPYKLNRLIEKTKDSLGLIRSYEEDFFLRQQYDRVNIIAAALLDDVLLDSSPAYRPIVYEELAKAFEAWDRLKTKEIWETAHDYCENGVFLFRDAGSAFIQADQGAAFCAHIYTFNRLKPFADPHYAPARLRDFDASPIDSFSEPETKISQALNDLANAIEEKKLSFESRSNVVRLIQPPPYTRK